MLIVKTDGSFLFSKCFSDDCRLDNITTLEVHQLFKTLKVISSEKPNSRIKTIIFEEMKLIVEARSEICVFIETAMEDEENQFRSVISKIADKINYLFETKGKDAVIAKVSTIVDTML